MYSKEEALRMIKNSLDRRVYRKMILALVIAAGLGGIYGIVTYRDYDPLTTQIYFAAMALIILPCIGFWWWKIQTLYREPEEYFFTRARLAAPHQRKWHQKGLSFTVIIDHPELGTLAADTNPIFWPWGIDEPKLETYLDKTVTVGYNSATGMVVVIE
ncbi:MAG: hypothetical protein IJ960_08885 [Oscillospiraceae bacterium]|nr:hypothetical protein [Oscillospiraceae bacterium]